MSLGTGKKLPNILLITWHDLGDWLHCYGHDDVESPCLDRLAEQGMLFTNNYCTSPQCSPSQASLVTSLMPHNSGILGLTHRGLDMGNSCLTMAMLFKKAYSAPLPKVELYDIEADPWEVNNLAEKPELSEMKANLSEKLIQQMKTTNDPLLNGPVLNPKPDTINPDFWVEKNGTYKLIQPGLRDESSA